MRPWLTPRRAALAWAICASYVGFDVVLHAASIVLGASWTVSGVLGRHLVPVFLVVVGRLAIAAGTSSEDGGDHET